MSTGSVSILITGSEILDGRVPDTNSHALIQLFSEHGIRVDHTLSCTDDLASLTACLKFLLGQSSTVIVSGGLGPTSDDLTRELVSAWAQAPLEERAEALLHLRSFYAARGRSFDESNRKQALFPQGARIIPNPVGTAPGFSIEASNRGGNQCVIALPGVPGELRRMLSDSVVPFLWQRLFGTSSPPRAAATRALRIFWVPESQVGARVAGIGIDPRIFVSYRAAFPEVHVLLKAPDPAFNEQLLLRAQEQARIAIGADLVIADSLDETLDSVVHDLLGKGNQRLAAAESCTGGMLGAMMTERPGSSRTFLGSAVTYSNTSKESILGVAHETLATQGAVSFAVAEEMAFHALKRFRADIAVSITGIAGPEGGSDTKPVGTFFVGFATAQKTESYRCFFASSRPRIRRFAVFTALDVVRRHLLELPVPWEHRNPGRREHPQ